MKIPEPWATPQRVFALILLGVTALYGISSWLEYSRAKARLDLYGEKVDLFEGQVERRESAEALKTRLRKTEESARKLFEILDKFQRPLENFGHSVSGSPVRTRIQEFREAAESSNFGIEKVEPFRFGFEAYRSSLPEPEIESVLFYELDAMSHLLECLIDSDAGSLDGFVREFIPGKQGATAEYEDPRIHKYPVRIRFRGSRDSLERFVNKISTDDDFFYQIRILKFESEAGDRSEVFERRDMLDVSMLIDIVRFVHRTESQ